MEHFRTTHIDRHMWIMKSGKSAILPQLLRCIGIDLVPVFFFSYFYELVVCLCTVIIARY